jgi:hypothetical protein
MTDWSEIAWHRSSYCANGNCVEVALLGNEVAVRDSKNPHGAMLLFSRPEWKAFLDGARSGEFDDIHNLNASNQDSLSG